MLDCTFDLVEEEECVALNQPAAFLQQLSDLYLRAA
jgi:hypothetical protein